MKYEYPAIISYNSTDKIYYVDFPDISNCFTDGKTLREALDNAEDVLNLMLLEMEEDKEKIPSARDKDSVKMGEGEIVEIIKADTDLYSKIAV